MHDSPLLARTRRRAPSIRVAALLLSAQPLVAAQSDGEAALDVVSIEGRPGYLRAIQDVAENRAARAIATFGELRDSYAGDPDLFMLDYNLACALARAGESAPALAALERAVACGYGLFGDQMQVLAGDPDLASLRDGAEYEHIFRQASERRRRWPQELRELRRPVFFVPAPSGESTTSGGIDGHSVAESEAAADEPLRHPLLLVLHDYGADHEVFARPFLEFGRAHGWAVFAPAAPLVVAPRRWAWFESSPDFVDSFRERTQDIYLALNPFLREQSIDRRRIHVVGFGQGASLAFALATRNPQWVRGAICIGGALPPSALHGWTEPAIHWGRQIRVLHGDSDTTFPPARVARYVEKCVKLGYPWSFHHYEGGHSLPDEFDRLLSEALAESEAAPFVGTPPDPAVLLHASDPPLLDEAADHQ